APGLCDQVPFVLDDRYSLHTGTELGASGAPVAGAGRHQPHLLAARAHRGAPSLARSDLCRIRAVDGRKWHLPLAGPDPPSPSLSASRDELDGVTAIEKLARIRLTSGDPFEDDVLVAVHRKAAGAL